jgi:hypothetical protein
MSIQLIATKGEEGKITHIKGCARRSAFALPVIIERKGIFQQPPLKLEDSTRRAFVRGTIILCEEALS